MFEQSNVRKTLAIVESVENRVMLSGSALANVMTGTPAVALSNSIAGLSATYYRGRNFATEELTRTDANIDFKWGGRAPAPALRGHAFSVEWTGQIIAPASGVYTITSVSDDGISVWIGGQLVINQWHTEWPTAHSGKITLEAGQSYDIKVDYFENTYPPADCLLSWKIPGQKSQIISSSYFRTQGGVGLSLGASPSAIQTPTNLTAVADSQSQITLNWDDVPGEAGFVVERSADNGADWTTAATLPAGQTSLVDTGLTANTTYSYRIYAMSVSGSSADSNVSAATTLAQTHLVYGLTNGGAVESIDTTTGAATQIGTMLFGTAAGDRDPLTGDFYYVDQNTNTPRIAMWDPTTNTNTLLGTVSLSGPVMRAAFDSQGVLYITAGNSDVYTINLTTGAATLVGMIKVNGSPLPTPSGDMAFAPDGTLYLDDGGAFYSINASTLAATYLGDDGNVGSVQIAFGSDGALYGADSNGPLYTINLTNGAATLVGNTGVSLIGDLASAPA